ncbi:UNVERIFIED_CONTAM: Checkpoint kinase 2, partial [Siphonaria sp. JEL0065]
MSSSFAETQEVEGGYEDFDEESVVLWGRLLPLDGGSPIELGEERDQVVLGRGGDVDVAVLGASISAKHCRIYRVRDDAGSVVMVEDLSRFGTFVGGKLVGRDKRTMLTHGAEIMLGNGGKTGFIFHIVKDSNSQLNNLDTPQSPFEAKYDMQEIVGRGNFSTVRLAVNKETGKRCAVKIIDKSKFTFNAKVLTALEREVEILRAVQPHVNVVQFEDSFEEAGGMLFIVMEFLPGGDLQKLVMDRGLLKEEEAKWLFLQMVTVLKHLKAKGITHRDLKPENFLVADGDILKLADFGIAMGSSKALSTMCGTPAYLAPEVILQKPYDDRVDIYSVGVILFFILSGGGTPYQDAATEMELFTRVKNGDADWSAPSWAVVSPAAKDLIKSLMRLNPDDRLKLEDIESHPWFKNEYGRLIHQETKEVFVFTEAMSRIGRLPSNDIVLLDPRISKNHCSITFSETAETNPILNVEGQNRVKVNTITATNPTPLRDGDIIQLASNLPNQQNLIYLFKSDYAFPPSPLKRKLSSKNASIPTAN